SNGRAAWPGLSERAVTGALDGSNVNVVVESVVIQNSRSKGFPPYVVWSRYFPSGNVAGLPNAARVTSRPLLSTTVYSSGMPTTATFTPRSRSAARAVGQ